MRSLSVEIDAKLRVGDEEVGDRGADFGEAEIGRRDHAQFAARLVVKFARGSLRLVQIGEDAPALFVECPPGGSDADAPRGAVEEARTKPRFEVQYVLAGRGARQPQSFRRTRKAARLDHGRKNPHVFEAIHSGPYCQYFADNLFRPRGIINPIRRG